MYSFDKSQKESTQNTSLNHFRHIFHKQNTHAKSAVTFFFSNYQITKCSYPSAARLPFSADTAAAAGRSKKRKFSNAKKRRKMGRPDRKAQKKRTVSELEKNRFRTRRTPLTTVECKLNSGETCCSRSICGCTGLYGSACSRVECNYRYLHVERIA